MNGRGIGFIVLAAVFVGVAVAVGVKFDAALPDDARTWGVAAFLVLAAGSVLIGLTTLIASRDTEETQ